MHLLSPVSLIDAGYWSKDKLASTWHKDNIQTQLEGVNETIVVVGEDCITLFGHLTSSK